MLQNVYATNYEERPAEVDEEAFQHCCSRVLWKLFFTLNVSTAFNEFIDK